MGWRTLRRRRVPQTARVAAMARRAVLRRWNRPSGDEADGGGRAVVEVVPAEELVEDDLVEGAGDAHAGQDAWPEQAVGIGIGHPPPPRVADLTPWWGANPAVSGGWRGG
jgi:hypothetical protein